jgi:alanine racemase
MNRLGLRHDNLATTLPELLDSRHLRLDAVYTHFATSDDPDSELFGEQRDRFFGVLDRLEAMGVTPALRHAANSAALLRDSRTWLDLVRPGLLLYGIVPPPLAVTLDLRPAMSLKSRVVAVKGVRSGERVGYGGRFVAERPTRIAIVPAGYADGLDARLEGRGHVLVRGHRAPIVGAVSMDMITLDVTGLTVEPGDEAVIIGTQGDERIDVREMAAAIGTIPYEIFCRIGARIERMYESETM